MTTTRSGRSTPSVPARMPTPPPTTRQELRDSDTAMGWTDRMSSSFHGFADGNEAAHAAWIACRTLARSPGREDRRQPIPIDSVPPSLGWTADASLILAGGRPVATLARPAIDSPSGPDSSGLELEMSAPTDGPMVRSTARLPHRTPRRPGIRWVTWTRTPYESTPAPSPAAMATDDSRAPHDRSRMGDGSGGRASLTRALSRHVGSRAAAAKLRDDSTGFLGAALIIVAIIVAMIAAVILPAITTTMAVSLLGTAAGLIALVALASLVHLVVTDVRDGLRERRRAKRAASAGRGLGHGRLPAPAGVSGA